MNLYPAMKGRMGSWEYFTVRMSMREIADNIKFAADIYDDRTLDEAIQRVLNESRVKKEIVTYLIKQPDRFFSSIVVAALGGNPKWYPVTMEDDERFMLFSDDRRFRDTFGVLSFDGDQDYFALDGQHRLASIKALVEPKSAISPNAPEGFKDEEVSVIVLVPHENESEAQFMMLLIRLFGNLNRYAKPTDKVTNIIMDEDDAFAILTRHLITDHSFFHYSGRQKESVKVKTTKGKNLRHNDSYFTSLEALYEINIILLSSRYRKNNGWNREGVTDSNEFLRFRPEEEQLEDLFNELSLYWNVLIDVLPVLKNDPSSMRDHSAPSGDGDTQDNFLFWPIGQEVLADLARDLMDLRQADPKNPMYETAKSAIQGLSNLTWDAHSAPWRNLMLIHDADRLDSWRIRSEERKKALLMMRRIFRWQLCIDELAEDEIVNLRDDWKALLLPALEDSFVDKLWKEIESNIIR